MRAVVLNENVIRMLDRLSLLGVVTGLTLLACGVFAPNLQHLTIPGLLFVVPSLIYGMR